jgi:hypothetical protein
MPTKMIRYEATHYVGAHVDDMIISETIAHLLVCRV